MAIYRNSSNRRILDTTYPQDDSPTPSENYAPPEDMAYSDNPPAPYGGYGYGGRTDPYDVGQANTYTGNDYTTSDPYEMMKQNRLSEIDRGNNINQGVVNDINFRRGNEIRYGNYMDQAAENLRQTPGYTPEESAGIMREGDLDSLNNVDYGSNFLTAGEQSDIKGDPSRYYNPGQIDDLNTDMAGNISTSLAKQEGALGNNIQTTREGLNNAITDDLNLSGEYRTNQDAVLNTTADKVNSAASSKDLQMSGDYARQAGMTDAEVDRTKEQASRTIGNRLRSAVGDLERNALASGNAGPLAIASARERLERNSAVADADAQTDAGLAARAQQRQAATGVENTRLSTARDVSNRGIEAGQYTGNLANQQVGERETNRLQSSRDVANRRADAAATTGQMGQQAALAQGSASIGAQQEIANRNLASEQYKQNAGAAVEGQQAQRAGYVAENRQGTNQTNQNNQWNRGYQTNTALSGRTQGVADARRTGQNQYLGWSTGQTNQNAELGTQARGQQIQNYGTQAQAVNGATSAYGDYDMQRRTSSFGGAFKKAAGAAFGNTVGGTPGYGFGGGN